MNLKEKYKNLEIEDLVRIVESPDFNAEARIIALDELKLRDANRDSLAAFSAIFFKGYFESQVRISKLSSLNDLEIPRSKFLSKKKIQTIIRAAIYQQKIRIEEFNRDLPMG